MLQLNVAATDTDRVRILGDIAWAYLSIDYDSAEFYSMLGLEEAKHCANKKYYADALSIYASVQRTRGKANQALYHYLECYRIRESMHDSVGMFKTLGNLGNLYGRLLNDHDSCILYYNKSLAIQQRIGPESSRSVTYLNISSEYLRVGNYLQAMENLHKAETIAEKYRDEEILSLVHSSLGHLFASIGQTDKGIGYLESSLNRRIAHGDSSGVAEVLNNIAAIQSDLENYALAIEQTFRVVRILEQMNDSLGLGMAYANMAILMLKAGNLTEGMKYGIMGLSISEKLNSPSGISHASNALGDIYNEMNLHQKAILHCKTGYKLSAESGNLEDLKNSCNCLYLAYDMLGDSKNALGFLKQAGALEDSLVKQARVATVVDIQMKYEFEKKMMTDSLNRVVEDKKIQLENQEAERKNQEQIRFQRWLLLGTLLLFAIVLLATIIFYRINRARQKALADRKLTEVGLMALRAQMNPHFIFNCLSSIQNCIDRKDFNLADEYLGKFSKLLRSVLKSSRKPFITVREEITYLTLYLDLERMRHNNQFRYHIQADEILEQENPEIPVMLIQPFVENSIKHGFPMMEGEGLVEINIHNADNNQFLITIRDNGIGRQKAGLYRKSTLKLQEHESLGMVITEERLNLLYKRPPSDKWVTINDLTNESGKAMGTEVILTIPTSK